MRQLKRQSREGSKTLDLTPFGLQHLADFLDNPKALHIETIYFTGNGNYFLNAFEWKGKIYSRLDFETVPMPGVIPIKYVRQKIGLEENLIVESLDAGQIVDLVFEWRENYAKCVTEIDPDTKISRTKWINDPEKQIKGLDKKIEKAKKSTKVLSLKEKVKLQNKIV